MRLILAFVLFSLGLPGAASAMTFSRCDKAEIAFATAAVVGAQELTRYAAAAVGDNEEYLRWFGTFDPRAAEKVRANLKAISRALARDDLHLICPAPGEDGCALDTYANVLPDRPYAVNLCSAFFGQPTMAGVVVTSRAFETGTREGTIIHEVSHFTVVAATEDWEYGRADCAELAKTAPHQAIDNADSYQYYAEDVVLAAQGRLR